jgi:hypothetical protein
VAWASSARMAAARCSSSRSVVAVRIRAPTASYLFFAVAAATLASSFFLNSTTSAAWRLSSVAIGGAGAAHQGVEWLTGHATEGERVTSP